MDAADSSSSDALDNPILRKLVDKLVRTLGDRLHSVVLYGSSARGDFQKRTSDFNLIVVLRDLEPASLEALVPALSGWLRRGRPMPRLFSPALIADAADVFPIEFLDIQACRVVLHGPDAFADVVVHHDHLRLQCERELREKMMRLREGVVEARGNGRAIRRLLTTSYGTFVALFRGCLHLLGDDVPVRNDEVVAAFCRQAELDHSPFDEIAQLKRGEKVATDPHDLLARYDAQLTEAVHRINRFQTPRGGDTA